MLWGGLGMLAAIFIMLEFVNGAAREWAAVIGGIGFGTFIDELGKFITSDNNYFYQPTVAVIYVVFVALFLSARWLNRPRALSPEEALVNASDILREGMLAGGLEAADRQTARDLLSRSNAGAPLAGALDGALDAVENMPHRHPPVLTLVRHSMAGFYARLVTRGWFQWLVVIAFIATALLGIAQIMFTLDWSWMVVGICLGCALALLALLHFSRSKVLRWRILRWVVGLSIAAVIAVTIVLNPSQELDTFGEGVELIASAATTLLTIIGVAAMPRSRLAAYQWFRRATLVSILLTQIFTFYQHQFVALGGLVVDLLLLLALRYMIDREKARLVP
jgi:hypothetical protein